MSISGSQPEVAAAGEILVPAGEAPETPYLGMAARFMDCFPAPTLCRRISRLW